MSYKKQNFQPKGQLSAAMLNYIEDGIVSLEKAISTLAKKQNSNAIKEISLIKDENGNIVGGNATLKNNTVVAINVTTENPTE
jgi:hypothetical protein